MKSKLLLRASAGLLACLLALGTTACSGDQGGTSENNESQAEKKTLKIITWSNQSSVDAINQLAEKYMDKYPNVTVELTDVDTNQYENLLTTRLQANDVDLITTSGIGVGAQVDWAPTEAPQWQKLCDGGTYLDLTDQPWVKNWSTGAEAGTYNGKVYAIATGANATTGIFYNKSLFTENGWKVPETWAEFETLCAAMKEKGITPMTCGGADQWPYTMIANDVMAGVGIDYAEFAKGLWTGDRKFTDDDAMLVYERLDFINQNLESGFMGISYAEVIGRFVAGKAAMLPDGAWQSTEIEKADANFEYGYFPMPGTEAGVNFEGKFDLYFAINSKSANVEEALNWMEMLSDPAYYTEFVNTCAFIPTMDDIEITNEFLASLLPYTSNLKNAWELEYRLPTGIGQYADQKGFNTQYLESAGGPISSIEELAELTQKDFDDAVAAATK